MKWILRLMETIFLLGLLSASVYFEYDIWTAITLSLPYLIITLLFHRFLTVREGLFTEAMLQNGIGMFGNSPVLPMSRDNGVHFFQLKGESREEEFGGYKYQINELKSHFLSGEKVKPFQLEGSYQDFLKEGRFLLHINFLIGVGFAGYQVWFNQMYLALLIPVLIGLYHLFFYSDIFESASALSWSNRLNKDREALTLIMYVYIQAILQIKDISDIQLGVLPTGDVLVSFTKDEVEHHYHVPMQDRIQLEMSIEIVEDDEDGDELKNDNPKQIAN